jgi:hypothetical protein
VENAERASPMFKLLEDALMKGDIMFAIAKKRN